MNSAGSAKASTRRPGAADQELVERLRLGLGAGIVNGDRGRPEPDPANIEPALERIGQGTPRLDIKRGCDPVRRDEGDRAGRGLVVARLDRDVDRGIGPGIGRNVDRGRHRHRFAGRHRDRLVLELHAPGGVAGAGIERELALGAALVGDRDRRLDHLAVGPVGGWRRVAKVRS